MTLAPPTLSAMDALLFDVDGTLYDQRSLRSVMALELVKAACLHPFAMRRNVVVLRAYRAAQEELRHESIDDDVTRDIGSEQIRRAMARSAITGVDHAAVVRAWMEERPLRFLAQRMRPGIARFLESARRKGLKLGVVSDYPARAKLDAMRVSTFFDVIVCAQDDQVGRFKPHPRGLLVAAKALGVEPGRTLYIGDRIDVDGEAARAAGMPCAIVGRSGDARASSCMLAQDFDALHELVFRE